MENLVSIKDRLKTINETNIQYLNLFNHPSLVYGNTVKSDKVDFCKYTEEIQEEMRQCGENYDNAMQYHKASTCGNRIRFKTSSRRLVFKVEFKRAYNYKNMVSWNSSGIEIFLIDTDGKYHNFSIIAPKEGYRIFAEQINIPPNSSVCIFLPNYNSILDMYIGFERGARIKQLPYPKKNRKPIVFYGNSITQGASATKSGNSFPNIVSRKLNHDIINLSMITCCIGTTKTAEMIGDIDCEAIVIDYSRYAPNLEFLKKTHEPFYKKIREKHPEKKIIIMTTACFNNWKTYDAYDDVIIQTYENAIANNENTLLLNQKELFDRKEYDLIAVDIGHYTDYGMFKIADKICELLNS